MERKPIIFASRRPSDNNSGGSGGVGNVGGGGGGGGGAVAIVGSKKDVGNNGGGRFARGGGAAGGGQRRSSRDVSGTSSPWSAAPRQRGFEKRPASKSVGFRPSDGHRSEVTTADGRAEIGSASRPGGRKPSLNHLLNFTYGSREDGGRGSHRGSGHRMIGANAANANSIWAIRKHKYNKEQFLQANCQFVVREGEDYAIHSADPDQLVNWEWIEQVRIPGHEVPSCPICLYPPVAAKMTRCGHVYCWTCMLHYLALTDKTWRKCPICYEAVHKGDLKSVISLETACYRVGDPISMQLMRRERGSMISLPRARWTEALEASGHLNVGVQGLDAAGDDACYAKLLVATRAQVLDVLSREQRELNAALVGDEADLGPESCFVKDALEQLKGRREKLLGVVEAVNKESAVDTVDDGAVAADKEVAEKTIHYACAFSDKEEDEHEVNERDATVHQSESSIVDTTSTGSESHVDVSLPVVPNNHLRQGQGHGKDTYYFYQAMDGQHIYMHSVNVAMLVREYGSLEFCPDVVRAPIVERETVSMNDDLRRRLRCLGHLPLTCQFELVELDFSIAAPAAALAACEPDVGVAYIVSRDTLLAFREEITKRSQRRSRRARDENRRERQLLRNENKGVTAPIRVPRLHLQSERQFPACGSDGGSSSGNSPSPTDEINSSNVAALSQPSASEYRFDSPIGSAGSSAMSFAQMLLAGKAKPNDVRSVKSVSGSGAVDGGYHHSYGEDDRDSDTGSPVPTFRDSFSAALWSALDDHQLGVRGGDEVNRDGDSGGHHRCKKGKKATKRLLFSTSVVQRSK